MLDTNIIEGVLNSPSFGQYHSLTLFLICLSYFLIIAFSRSRESLKLVSDNNKSTG